jgi:glutamate/tyrosine decarboxylase-like PLP-dependent enzyme
MAHNRKTPIVLSKEEFKKIGYQLIDRISEFNDNMDARPVTYGESPAELKEILGSTPLPEQGKDADELIQQTTELLFNHSLFNGHPKFLGYITSSATPIGALADLLASTVNPNVGGQILSPIATEIEKQTIQWLAEFIGYPSNCGGILVSGGNMANFTAFLAARTAKAPKNIKEDGLTGLSKKLVVYCSKTTHTWIDKASILFGLGSDAVRWIPADEQNRMNIDQLEKSISEDLNRDHLPIMVIGTAGDVSTGSVDDLEAISKICSRYDLWFHVDGAYGVPAAVVPEYRKLFKGIDQADSVAMDPHKWLYSPLEAGCTLVRDPQHLLDTYSSNPEYYKLNHYDQEQNYFEFGLQNSRGFRALKVWLALQQVGRQGYEKMIREDITLSKLLYELADGHPELEAVSNNLSITVFRYLPEDSSYEQDYLNELNEELLNTLQLGGELFLSNAVVNGNYCLRGCIVNFRTSEKDIREIIDIVVRVGRSTHEKLKN